MSNELRTVLACSITGIFIAYVLHALAQGMIAGHFWEKAMVMALLAILAEGVLLKVNANRILKAVRQSKTETN